MQLLREARGQSIGSDPASAGGSKSASQKTLLRFMTCGSVDDGKSTLVGRLLLDLAEVPDDMLEMLESERRKRGAACLGSVVAYLVDGLEAEREQGITIDVAYRYFSAAKRKFIVADTPGHEQYTRNMATAASVSDLAVILTDARKGVVTQTRRHSAIAHLLGIRHVVLAINKMDLVDFAEDRFEEIRQEYVDFATRLGIGGVTCIPVVATTGHNVVQPGKSMPWYTGPTVSEHLEQVEICDAKADGGLLMPVQWVNRTDADFRGLSGTLARGSVKRGDRIVLLPSAQMTSVKRITTFDGDLDAASAGEPVTVELEHDLDASRGDVVAAPTDRPEVTDQFAAHLIWLGDEPMLVGRQYLLKCATQTVAVSVTSLKHKLDVNTLAETAGRQLSLNEIALCNFSCSRPIAVTSYDRNRTLGAFILIDRITQQTVGAGLIRFGLRRAANVHLETLDIDRRLRAAQKGQKPFCIWLTGLSGAGKSTIANALDRRLYAMGHHAFLLDGDNVRHGLNRDLGFTDADRVENIRRVAEVARLMVDAGLITIVSFISPFRAERRMARERFEAGDFLEAFVDTPLEVCEARDAKGLYKSARAGLIKNFTGIDSRYEEPEDPDIRLKGGSMGVDEFVGQIISVLERRGLFGHAGVVRQT